MVTTEDLQELKNIFFRLYKRVLRDDEALDLASRLVGLFKVIAKPIPKIDNLQEKEGQSK